MLAPRTRAAIQAGVASFLFVAAWMTHFVGGMPFLPRTRAHAWAMLLLLFGVGVLLVGILADTVPIITNPTACVVRVPRAHASSAGRGDNYYLDQSIQSRSTVVRRPHLSYQTATCLLPYWGLCHLLFFAVVGFLVPTLWLPAYVGGILWEGIEYAADVHDVRDMAWNAIGLALGIGVRRWVWDAAVGGGGGGGGRHR